MFQFTPPRKGRPPGRAHSWTYRLRFNSRPCVRGDRFPGAGCAETKSFNSRPRVRGDYKAYAASKGVSLFQFTPPRKGRLPTVPSHSDGIRRFNSRPRVRGDVGFVGFTFSFWVSIHAPA